MDDAIRHRGDAYDAYEMLIKRGEKIFLIMLQKHPGQKLGCLKTPLPSELSSRLVAVLGTSPPAGWLDGETNGNIVEDCFFISCKVTKNIPNLQNYFDFLE